MAIDEKPTPEVITNFVVQIILEMKAINKNHIFITTVIFDRTSCL